MIASSIKRQTHTTNGLDGQSGRTDEMFGEAQQRNPILPELYGHSTNESDRSAHVRTQLHRNNATYQFRS